MAQRVRKAVLPVAGLGTRFLPATKAMPKEMLTVVDRPLIQYAVEECLAAGIEEFVFVTGRNKSALEDHFDSAYELEATLHQRGKARELKQTQDATIKAGNAIFTRQQKPLGLGHAVWCARDWIGREPFAVLLPDELTIDAPSCIAQLVGGPRQDRRQRGRGDGRAARADQELRHRRGEGREGRAGRDHRPGREAQARGGAVDAGADRPLRPAARGVRPSRPARDRRRRRDPAHRRAWPR